MALPKPHRMLPPRPILQLLLQPQRNLRILHLGIPILRPPRPSHPDLHPRRPRNLHPPPRLPPHLRSARHRQRAQRIDMLPIPLRGQTGALRIPPSHVHPEHIQCVRGRAARERRFRGVREFSCVRDVGAVPRRGTKRLFDCAAVFRECELYASADGEGCDDQVSATCCCVMFAVTS